MPEQRRSRTSALSRVRARLRLRNLGENPAGLETFARELKSGGESRGKKKREKRKRKRERERKREKERERKKKETRILDND